MRTSRNPRRRRLLQAGSVAGLLVVLLASASFGRAVPTNNYRPELPPDALATGCYPLPDGVHLVLPHQIRSDRDVLTVTGPRRELLGQYDLVDRDDAERQIVGAFALAGYAATGLAGPDGSLRLTNRAGAHVVVTVTALPGTSSHTLVRGTFLLDLPRTARASDDPICDNAASTKRWLS